MISAFKVLIFAIMKESLFKFSDILSDFSDAVMRWTRNLGHYFSVRISVIEFKSREGRYYKYQELLGGGIISREAFMYYGKIHLKGIKASGHRGEIQAHMLVDGEQYIFLTNSVGTCRGVDGVIKHTNFTLDDSPFDGSVEITKAEWDAMVLRWDSTLNVKQFKELHKDVK